MTEPPNFSFLLVLTVCAGIMTSCATKLTPNRSDALVRYYTPSAIIVGARSTGKFVSANGCIFFDHQTKRPKRVAALFPPGTRLSDGGRLIMLSNGQSMSFNQTVTIAYEAPPVTANVDRSCGNHPIQVLNIVEEEAS